MPESAVTKSNNKNDEYYREKSTSIRNRRTWSGESNPSPSGMSS